MANQRQNRLVTLLTMSLIALSGFVFQLFHIGDEYFKYPTLTHVSIKNWLETTLPPKVIFCTPFNVTPGIKVKDFFALANDTILVEYVEYKTSETDSLKI